MNWTIVLPIPDEGDADACDVFDTAIGWDCGALDQRIAPAGSVVLTATAACPTYDDSESVIELATLFCW